MIEAGMNQGVETGQEAKKILKKAGDRPETKANKEEQKRVWKPTV